MQSPTLIRALLKKALSITSLLMVLITGCGGDNPERLQYIDPSASYTGALDQAVVTKGNTLEIVETNEEFTYDIHEILELVFQSIPVILETNPDDIRNQEPERIVLYNSNDGDGGTVSYRLTINDSTGYYWGTATYNKLNRVYSFFDGTINISGSFDPGTANINRLSLSFVSLSKEFSGGYQSTYTGMLSLVIENYVFNVSANMIITIPGKKTFWANDYNVKYFLPYEIESLSGRFYHPDYGYLTLSTPLKFDYYYNHNRLYPTQGILMMTGKDGTWVKKRFIPLTEETYWDTDFIYMGDFFAKLVYEADTDGDGISDWFHEIK